LLWTEQWSGWPVKRLDQGIPSTDFNFTVSSTVSDPRHLLTTSPIIIHQTGGTITQQVNGNVVQQTFEVGDDPLMQAGDHFFLFLHNYAPNRYFVVGGPSGRFVVINEQVRPLNDEGVKLPQALSESSFAAQVQAD
jgi:hypothetical protein